PRAVVVEVAVGGEIRGLRIGERAVAVLVLVVLEPEQLEARSAPQRLHEAELDALAALGRLAAAAPLVRFGARCGHEELRPCRKPSAIDAGEQALEAVAAERRFRLPAESIGGTKEMHVDAARGVDESH